MPRANTLIVYADSGDTKTSQVYHLAKWMFETKKKKTRLITADGGGWAPCRPLVELGIIDVFDICNRKLALADCRRLSEGYWPRVVEQNGKKIRMFTSSSECKTTIEEWKEIGLVVVEGATSVCRLLLKHIASQDVKVAFEQPYRYEEDGYVFGGNSKGDYGMVQNELNRLIVNGFHMLPVDLVMYTALVGKGTLKRTSETIYGPQAAGEAITAEIPNWVGHCIHIDRIRTVEGDDAVKESVVAWFVNHTDGETGIRYLAKPRIEPGLYPQLMKLFPNGYVKMGFKRGLDVYLEAIDKLGDRKEEWEKWKKEIESGGVKDENTQKETNT